MTTIKAISGLNQMAKSKKTVKPVSIRFEQSLYDRAKIASNKRHQSFSKMMHSALELALQRWEQEYINE